MSTTQTGGGFASILTHFDLTPQSEARGRLAVQLAEQHGAHFIGAAAEQQLLEVYNDMTVNVSATVSDEERARVEGDLKAVRRIFDAVVGARNDVEWRSCVTDPERFLIEQARAADLVVIGRRSTYDARDGTLGVRPGNIVLECGRPILVVPPEKDYLAAHKVLVAWKDTREARRALRDALPILRQANEVVVMTAAPAYRDAGAEDVSIWLDRHGVRSRVSVHTGEVANVAAQLIDVADDIGADLIVSGAYGHSRTREWFFGGATRDLLENSKHCLFMSH
ncbi:universal stress protein [Hansschlegelia zhihuaiae]|uniref:Universal stress protein n=1 Tax=Hansschlegelia zhihuaiae TaxID=405005 RepID=A0A4Q0MHW7_9HYPH|nr:universal stress protein [Hansschlegelia zhihuaiae]RXF73187.1 universal stress protein [Hansschlegelia zhihuaiae]